MQLWMHFSFAAERQMAWAMGKLEHPPAGLTEMPDMDALFETIWTIDQEWMPQIRDMVAAEEASGKRVIRLKSPAELDGFLEDHAD